MMPVVSRYFSDAKTVETPKKSKVYTRTGDKGTSSVCLRLAGAALTSPTISYTLVSDDPKPIQFLKPLGIRMS